MLVSLSKNQFLYDWMREKWHSEILEELVENNVWYSTKDDIKLAKKQLAQFLCSKGYVSKVTSGNDVIISMSEEQFIFLRLKYE